MLYINQVKYKMKEEEPWQNGWLIGEHIDIARTLLDEEFNPVPKLDGGHMCWDLVRLKTGAIEIQI